MKNYVAIQDGKVTANEGGTNLTVESMRERYPKAEIKAVGSTKGIPVGLPIALYGKDYTLKTPQELEAEGLDQEGNKLPTAAEIEAETKAKAEAEQKAAELAEVEAAKAELGDGEWTEDQIKKQVALIKYRELRISIYSLAGQKYRNALTSIFGNQERYEMAVNRHKRAKGGAFVDSENKEIIEKYELNAEKLNTKIDEIEEIQTFILDILDNDRNRADTALSAWENLADDDDLEDFLSII